MNKTKKGAWHKHLKKAKKREEKLHTEAGRPAAATTGPTPRTTTRRPSTSTPRS